MCYRSRVGMQSAGYGTVCLCGSNSILFGCSFLFEVPCVHFFIMETLEYFRGARKSYFVIIHVMTIYWALEPERLRGLVFGQHTSGMAVTEISQRLWDGFPCSFVHTFMFPQRTYSNDFDGLMTFYLVPPACQNFGHDVLAQTRMVPRG